MIEYALAFVIINLTLIFKKLKNEKLAKFLTVIIPLTYLFILMVFRDYSVGSDVPAYYSKFLKFQNNGFNTTEDYGFHIILYFFAKTTGSFRLFLVLLYLIYYVGFGLLLYKYAKNIQVALLVYSFSTLFQVSVSGLRQTFGIAFCFFAIYFFYFNFKSKILNWSLSIFMWIIGCTMHLCIAFFILFYLLNSIEFNYKKIPLYTAIFILCSICCKYLFDFFSLIGNLDYGSSGKFIGFPKVALLYYAILLAIVLIEVLSKKSDFISRLISFENVDKKYYSFQFLALLDILINSTVTFSVVFARFGIIFTIFFLFYFSDFFECFKNKNLKLLFYISLNIASVIGFYITCVRHDACNVYPFNWGFGL